jgi:toxin ParE1/3/4
VKVRWLLSATVALRAIHAHIAVENPKAARRVVRGIRSATDHLRDFPASGRNGTVPGTREVVVPGLPYLLVYRVTDNEVQIIRIFHTAMEWR